MNQNVYLDLNLNFFQFYEALYWIFTFREHSYVPTLLQLLKELDLKNWIGWIDGLIDWIDWTASI